MIDLSILSEPMARLVLFSIGAGSIACVLGLLIGGHKPDKVLCDPALPKDDGAPDFVYLPNGSFREE